MRRAFTFFSAAVTPNQSQLSSSKAIHFCHQTPLDAKSPSSNSPILNLAILVAKCNVLTCSLLNTPNKILNPPILIAKCNKQGGFGSVTINEFYILSIRDFGLKRRKKKREFPVFCLLSGYRDYCCNSLQKIQRLSFMTFSSQKRFLRLKRKIKNSKSNNFDLNYQILKCGLLDGFFPPNVLSKELLLLKQSKLKDCFKIHQNNFNKVRLECTSRGDSSLQCNFFYITYSREMILQIQVTASNFKTICLVINCRCL